MDVENGSAAAAAEVAEFEFTLSERTVSFNVDEGLYSLDAIYGASYLFVNRCYVLLDRPAEGKVGVRLKTKETSAEDELEALAGEFANELLNQVLRLRIGESTAKLRDHYMARAFFSEDTRETIETLLAELDSEEMEEDELEIAVPWEQKRDEQKQEQNDQEQKDG